MNLQFCEQPYHSYVQGQVCENTECAIKLHYHCVARYFKGRLEPHCPSCSDFWAHEIPGMIYLKKKVLSFWHEFTASAQIK